MKTAMVVLLLGVTLALLTGGEAAPAAGGGKVPASVFPMKANLFPSGGSGYSLSHTYVRVTSDMSSSFAAKVDQIIINAINANEDFSDAAEEIQEKLEEEDEGSKWDVAVIDYDGGFGMKFYHQLFSYMFSAMRARGDWKRWIVVHK